MAFDPTRTTNAQLMVDCQTLGYLPDSPADYVLDATYGLGSFWKGELAYKKRPFPLWTNDIDPGTKAAFHYDYTKPIPCDSRFFHTVVFDPPYKLNGTPTPNVDDRYGVGKRATKEERISNIMRGIKVLQRLADRYLLVKIQDQVSGGKVNWLTYDIAEVMDAKWDLVWRKKDELYVSSYRPQPAGRTQLHARRNYSTLMVFERTT